MRCPDCEKWTSVLETRTSAPLTVRRRYECANGHRFTTHETVVPTKKKPRTFRTRVKVAFNPLETTANTHIV